MTENENGEVINRFTAGIPDEEYWMNRIPCQVACPVKTDAGRYVQQIAEGDFLEGYVTARSPNPFASVCGRICAAPCEDACRRGLVDKPISIRALKRFLTERYGVESMDPVGIEDIGTAYQDASNKYDFHLGKFYESREQVGAGNQKQKVAVIGAGPAGVSAAHDLALMGYDVTIFEKSGQVGGMTYHGVPEFRLPRSIIQEEVNQVKELGVDIRLNTPLTEDFGLPELRERGFEAFFLAVGVQEGRDMQVPGHELDGVVKAIDFLININNGYRVDVGENVLVIGGGLVAFDAARMAMRTALIDEDQEEADTDELSEGESAVGGMQAALDSARLARRRGAVDVQIASLESYQEMPALQTEQGKEELEHARQEGIDFLPQWGVKEFVGSDGQLEKVVLKKVKRVYDEEGNFDPVYDENDLKEVETDVAILAIGQTADLSFLTEEDGVEVTPRQTIKLRDDGQMTIEDDPALARVGNIHTCKINEDTLRTTADDVFAGGDIAFGPRNVIDAVSDGKKAAMSIDAFLKDREYEQAVKFRFEKIPSREYEMPDEFEQLDREAPETIDLEKRTGISEVEEVYEEEEARRQAERCLSCHIQTAFDAGLCVMCNRCVDVCPTDCLKLVDLAELQLEGADKQDVLDGRDIDVEDEDVPLTAMLKDDELCIRCGLCAVRCPTDAMTMEVMYYEEEQVPA